jgi:hypothetical protein
LTRWNPSTDFRHDSENPLSFSIFIAQWDAVIPSLVEGFFKVVNVHQAGLPCVVALMGCSLSRRQEELLQEHFREVVLLLDGDTAGRRAGVGIDNGWYPRFQLGWWNFPAAHSQTSSVPTRFDVSAFQAISEGTFR